MVLLVIDLLELNKGDEVIDFFCGLDNFTLPIAKYVRLTRYYSQQLPLQFMAPEI
jgi:tRNA/tmRNA/rRNA uracil-C5-methylase (TrmA/RlmC/RlmD family)